MKEKSLIYLYTLNGGEARWLGNSGPAALCDVFFFQLNVLYKMVDFHVSQLLQSLHFPQCSVNPSVSGLVVHDSTFLLSSRP